MSKTQFICTLPINVQTNILQRVKKYFTTELKQDFTREEKETVLNSRLCDLESILL